jgi:hypothetical protein
MSVLKTECNYSVHVRTVQLKSKSYLRLKTGWSTLHLGLHVKGNGPQHCLELADGTGLTYFWWYAVPGDDGTRKE